MNTTASEADTVIINPETGLPDGMSRYEARIIRTFGGIEKLHVWAMSREHAAAAAHQMAVSRGGADVLYCSAAPAEPADSAVEDLRMDADRAALLDLLRLGGMAAAIVAVIAFCAFGPELIHAVWDGVIAWRIS